jgi:hypothetical protein
MLNYHQVRAYICIPALHRIALWSQAAENLVMGTALVESKLTYIDQIDKANKPGPAYGLCQMEKATHDDLWKTILERDALLRLRVVGTLTDRSTPFPPAMAEMHFNHLYAFVMCRVHYRRVKEALPDANDAMGLAKYHKKYYNTYLGKTEVEESVKQFEYVIARSKESV